MTTGRINQVASRDGRAEHADLRLVAAESSETPPPFMASARCTDRPSSFSCEAVLHGQRWARVPPLANTVALPLLAAPRAGAPGKSSRTDNTVARLFEGNTDFGGARTDADTPRTANNWHKHRANTDRSRPVRRPNINQRFQPTRPSRLTRSYDPVLHALPPRLMHSLQARGHCSTASQSPKWPPRTQLSVIAIQSSERSEATRRPFKEEP